MKSRHSLPLVAVSTFATLIALALSLPAQAAIVNKTFKVSNPDNPNEIWGTGAIAYDDSDLFYTGLGGQGDGYGTNITTGTFEADILDKTFQLTGVAFVDQGNKFFRGIFAYENLPDGNFSIRYDNFNVTSAQLSGNFFNAVTYSDATPVPTPALLPGLLALGAGIIRKRKQETSV